MRKFTCVLFAVCTVAVGLSLANHWRAPIGPQSLADAIALSEKAGFVCITQSGRNVPGQRVVISFSPLDEDDLTEINVSIPRPGTACCYLNWDCSHIHTDAANSAFWGEMFVYGDPAVVDAITGRNPVVH